MDRSFLVCVCQDSNGALRAAWLEAGESVRGSESKLSDGHGGYGHGNQNIPRPWLGGEARSGFAMALVGLLLICIDQSQMDWQTWRLTVCEESRDLDWIISHPITQLFPPKEKRTCGSIDLVWLE